MSWIFLFYSAVISIEPVSNGDMLEERVRNIDYSHIHCLEAPGLMGVFRDLYRLDTEYYSIPSLNPNTTVLGHIIANLYDQGIEFF
jgi:hypothetical protein